MTQRIRVIVSIVISAVMLGLVVVYCIKWWMPVDAIGWVIWGAMAVAGISAVYGISNLAQILGDKDNE